MPCATLRSFGTFDSMEGHATKLLSWTEGSYVFQMSQWILCGRPMSIAGLVMFTSDFSAKQESPDEEEKSREPAIIHNIYAVCDPKNLCELFSPCRNGGTCYPITESDGKQWFVCKCRHGFVGEICADVVAVPRIDLDGGPTFVEQNTNGTLPKCHATGIPVPEVKWSKVGGSLPTHSVDKDGELKLFNVTKRDTGQYKCKATNTVGSDEAETSVEVIEFEKPPEILNTTQGADEIVKCRATTEFELQSIQWSKSNRELPVLADGTLELTNIQAEDAGRYVCTVSVGNLKFVAEMQLDVLDIDECLSAEHNCHPAATCQNTIGSFKCKCNSEYRADEVDWTDNFALGKPASHSSDSIPPRAAWKAVDGNTNTNINPGDHCTHTNEQTSPWWRVDLGSERKVAEVKIWNRGDCCGERLSGFQIIIGNKTYDGSNGKVCGTDLSVPKVGPGCSVVFRR